MALAASTSLPYPCSTLRPSFQQDPSGAVHKYRLCVAPRSTGSSKDQLWCRTWGKSSRLIGRPRTQQRRPASLGKAVSGIGTEEKEEMKWVHFPRLSSAGQRLMEDIAGSMDSELASLLNPSRTSPDVRSFKSGTGEGSVTLRSGKAGSKIDFVLGSWLHCNLPFGNLNIATLIAMLGPEADSPHLLFEFIQSGPSSLVLVIDLLPRKDLVLEQEYLQRFYENTELEKVRQEFEKCPQAQPYLSSSLYVRSVVSPTASLYKFSGEGIEGGLDGVITEVVHPAVKKVFLTWLHAFQYLGQDVKEEEKVHLTKRDAQIKTQGVEVDLSANMPKLFGQEITDQVVAAFRKGE